MVEFALVMPIFVLLLVGAVEFGRLAFEAIEVSNAAYAGAAYGAQNHATASDTNNIVLAATSDAANVPGISATATFSCSCTSGVAVTCATASSNCAAPGRIVESVQVNTTAAINTLLHYPGLPTVVTLQGQAIMRVEK